MRALFVLLLCAAGANAQTVYKCVDARGTTEFSRTPCADDPAKMEAVDTSGSKRTGTGGSVSELNEYAQMNELRRRCDARIQGIASAYSGQHGRVNAQIADLERQIARAKNNLAGATWESGMRQQIAGLVTERGSLRAAEASETTVAREQCRQDIQAEEQRQAEAGAARRQVAEQAAEQAAANAATEAAAKADAKASAE